TVPSKIPLPDAPTTLEPMPSAKPGAAPGTSSTSGSGAGRTSYSVRPSATKTAVRLGSGLATERATIGRPGRQSSAEAATERAAGDEDNPLDPLPPLGLPGEVTESSAASPAPSAFGPEGKGGAVAAARASDAPTEDAVNLLGADAAAEPGTAPGAPTGIARF